ncbi:MAG: hypothetical protein H6564_09585 [Lewinellaceae bacterium]|nr:hypothetical protein [Lewinellaceae bacterium]
MNRDVLHQLIEKGAFEEAMTQLMDIHSGSGIEKEVRLLRARYREAQRQRDQGVMSWEQFNLEQNRLIKALLGLADMDNTASPKGRKKWPFALAAFIVLLAVASMLFFRQGSEKPNPGATLEQAASAAPPPVTPADIVKTAKAGLAGQHFQFTLTGIAFLIDRNYQSFIARLTRRFTWKASFPCRLDGSDIQVSYDSLGHKLLATAGPAYMEPNFFVYDKASNTRVNVAWIEESSMDGEFWSNINGTTIELANGRLRNDGNIRLALKVQATDLVETAIRKSLEGLNVDSLAIEVTIPNVRLFDGSNAGL